MIITRKIELWVQGDTKEEKNSAWNFLRQLSRDVCKAYNLVTSNQYFNELFTERIRKTDDELADKDEKLDTEIKKLGKEIKDCKDKEEKKSPASLRCCFKHLRYAGPDGASGFYRPRSGILA